MHGSKRVSWPIAAALVVSVAAHLALFVWWPDSSEPDRPLHTPELLVTLVPPAERLTAEPDRPEVASEAEENPELVDHEPLPPAVPELAIKPDPDRMTDATESAPPPLDLNRPESWADVVQSGQPPAEIQALPFSPGLREGAILVRESRQRQMLFALRHRAVHGMSDEEFATRVEPDGETIKLNGQCFTLKESEGLGEQPHWWMSACREPRQNPWTLDPLEFDAVGRVIAD